jgi:hypothetical protein
MEADDVYSETNMKDVYGLTSISFQKSIPSPPTSANNQAVQLLWTIEKMGRDKIIGVQSKVGQTPRRFIAQLSVDHQTGAKSASIQ